jgi:hypothetical protein
VDPGTLTGRAMDLTCASGPPRTRQTPGTRLRIKRLGVRVPPSALQFPQVDGPVMCRRKVNTDPSVATEF